MKKQGQQGQQNMKKKYVKPEMTVIHMPGVSMLVVSGYAEQDFSKKNNSNGLFDSDIEDEGKSTQPFHEYLWE